MKDGIIIPTFQMRKLRFKEPDLAQGHGVVSGGTRALGGTAPTTTCLGESGSRAHGESELLGTSIPLEHLGSATYVSVTPHALGRTQPRVA